MYGHEDFIKEKVSDKLGTMVTVTSQNKLGVCRIYNLHGTVGSIYHYFLY